MYNNGSKYQISPVEVPDFSPQQFLQPPVPEMIAP